MPRNALLVEIADEDLAYAVRQNRYACAIVRAVQRKLPEALRVTADAEKITFTMPDDHLPGQDGLGVRYICPVPRKVRDGVIKSFDLTGEVADEFRSFTVTAAEAVPVKHNTKHRQVERDRARLRNRSRSPQVRTYNRFLDSEAEQSSGGEIS